MMAAMPWRRAPVASLTGFASWALAVASTSVLLAGPFSACTRQEKLAEQEPAKDEPTAKQPVTERGPAIEDRAQMPPSPPPPPTKVLQVAAGNYNACVRFDNGTVSCWGRCVMGCGALSHETSTSMRTIPGVTNAVDVAVGDSFACAAQADGRVLCWGSNFYGALGTAGVDWVAAPREVEGLADAVEVEASQTMTCARTRSGDVQVWGGVADASPPPPDSTRRPRAVPQIRGATALSSDPWGCCAALGDGSFACVQAGDAVATPRPMRSGACGCGLDAGGTLRCELRSLPGPPTSDGMHPEPPRLPCSIDAVEGVQDFVIADTAGYAIRRDGELWRWGGIDQWGSWSALARMTAPAKVRSIATGVRGAVLAVDDAGALWGWAWSYEHGITASEGWVGVPLKIWPEALAVP